MYFIINKAFWKLNLCFMILTVLGRKNTSYYHLVAAFIPKVFCSVQRWTHFTYCVANSWILITHRVWSPLKGYKPTQRHLDLINIHKPLYQFSNFPGGGAPSKTTDFSRLLCMAATLRCDVTASRARGCVRGIWERWLRDEGRGLPIWDSLFQDRQVTAEDEAENSTRLRKYFLLRF